MISFFRISYGGYWVCHYGIWTLERILFYFDYCHINLTVYYFYIVNKICHIPYKGNNIFWQSTIYLQLQICNYCKHTLYISRHMFLLCIHHFKCYMYPIVANCCCVLLCFYLHTLCSVLVASFYAPWCFIVLPRLKCTPKYGVSL
jgi:hypothetical protein